MREKFKAIAVLVLSALTSWMGVLALPVLVLLCLEVIDYATGIFAARYRNEQVNSYKGLYGIIKKLFLLVLVCVAGLLDWTIAFAGESVGITLPFNFVIACVTSIWLICNEIISILENMIDIGIKLPPFLEKIAKQIRRQAEIKTEIEEEK